MTSPSFLPDVEDYLALRRDLGFSVETQSWLLRDFARYADRTGAQGSVTIDLAMRWASSSCPSDPARAERRLWAVRMYARHRAAFDPATEIPPAGLFGRIPGRKQPHIYSEPEVSAFLEECGRLQPRRGLRPVTYRAFFSLLVSTGLRLSEARLLERRDVDLGKGLLTIRAGKFRKSRLVPIHSTGVQALARYVAQRDRRAYSVRSDFFFRTDRSPALRRAAVENTFSSLRDRLGWTSQGRARRPRIQDFRHSFAVRRLLRWYEEGVDVDRRILALSTYLGHARVTDTYWYLSAVPELMAITSQRFEFFARREQESRS
jgi:integrase